MTYDVKPAHDLPSAEDELLLPGDAPKRRKIQINEDVYCVYCGYNLRGLTHAHRCPECGVTVVATIGGNDLHKSPASWLHVVKNGLGLLLAATAMAIGASLAAPAGQSAAVAFDMISAVLTALGVVLITTPEPRTIMTEKAYNIRQALRMVALARLIARGVSLAFLVSVSVKVAAVANIIALLMTILLIWGLAFYLKRFAARLPDPALERSTHTVAWGITISIAVIIFFSAFSYVTKNNPRLIGPAPCIAVCGMLSLWYCCCWFMLLLFKYYSTFKWAAHDAEIIQFGKD